MEQFSSLAALAGASQATVLTAWNGLGYNRRAVYAHRSAKQIMEQFDGLFPNDVQLLTALPGVGSNTAAAICVYAYNQPLAFIETNIRTVFIHHFFKGRQNITDREILALVVDTLPKNDPRSWYYALMDYGAHLKKTAGNAAKAAQAYKKQTAFAGSRREVRGRIIRLLVSGSRSQAGIRACIDDVRTDDILSQLASEGLITLSGSMVALAE